jgi:hypothetical protein
MNNETIKLLDVVALTQDLPEHGLRRGQVGTVVELLRNAFEVEFADQDGQTYAMVSLRPEQLLLLRYESSRAAG